jgi:hypothetical protein
LFWVIKEVPRFCGGVGLFALEHFFQPAHGNGIGFQPA